VSYNAKESFTVLPEDFELIVLDRKFAGDLVDVVRPGDFNQGLMELGALVCTPRTPSCSECPISTFCIAKSQEKHTCSCSVCATWTSDIEELGAVQYPRKITKKAARAEEAWVIIVQCGQEFLITQRPNVGFLAGMWEFPNFPDESSIQLLLEDSNDLVCKCNRIGKVAHLFSHIKWSMNVFHLKVEQKYDFNPNWDKKSQWVSEEEFEKEAVSTGMKKVFALLHKKQEIRNSKKPMKIKTFDNKVPE
jgi:A/G-specific adenine glycosylase